ncbi:MAG: helix-turn-helix transcriptional regulator [Clostridia bacterium]|nr:helix-turn-helix transcriptional regulator [Clostridia bacterium]
MKLVEAISQRIKNLLQERNLKPYSLYKNGGVPRSTLSDVLNLNKKKVTTDTVYQVCATLQIDLKTFFDDPMFDDLED